MSSCSLHSCVQPGRCAWCCAVSHAEKSPAQVGTGDLWIPRGSGAGKASAVDIQNPFPLPAATRTSAEFRHLPVTCHHGTGHDSVTKCPLGASETVSLLLKRHMAAKAPLLPLDGAVWRCDGWSCCSHTVTVRSGNPAQRKAELGNGREEAPVPQRPTPGSWPRRAACVTGGDLPLTQMRWVLPLATSNRKEKGFNLHVTPL